MCSGSSARCGRSRAWRMPRLSSAVVLLERLDLFDLAERVAQLVDALEQATPGEGVDLEAVAAVHGLLLQVDRHLAARIGRYRVHDLENLIFVKHHRQEAVLQRIAGKDVAEARRD